MIVRNETAHDWPAVRHVVAAAFGQAAEAELVEALRRSGDTAVSLVAEDDGQIVGHVALSRMAAPFPALALAPLSVVPSRQRQGVGAGLVREAIDHARAAGWIAIFVLGDPDYYGRFGLDAEAAAGFASPYAGRHFMALALCEPLPTTAGLLRHAPAFGALD